MLFTTLEERLWYVRNLALGLVSYLSVTEPPVFVENLLRYPPAAFKEPQDQHKLNDVVWQRILSNSTYIVDNKVISADLPIEEKRYTIAREFICAVSVTQQGREMGLDMILDSYSFELQDYFARVLLTPDDLLRAYRMRGGRYEDFAETFIIPARIAAIRWQESLSPSVFEVV